MLKFARNKLVNVARKDPDTLAVHGVLDDDIYSLELDVLIRLSDLEILDLQGRWHRWTTPECPRATNFLTGAVGLRIGSEGFGDKVHRVVGRKACRHYANLLLECCHAAKEAAGIIAWEGARASDPSVRVEDFVGAVSRSGGSHVVAGTPQTSSPSSATANRTSVQDPAVSSGGMIVDLHVHTAPASPCASASVHEMIQEAIRVGLDAICFTDHNHVWKADQVEELRQRYGLLVCRGNEITTNQGDILVFGLDEDVQGIIDIAELRERVLRADGFMIVAHPFRGFLAVGLQDAGLTVDQAVERSLFQCVDAVEVFNGRSTRSENEFSVTVAERLGLPATGGSDAHETFEIGLYATRFAEPIRNEAELIQALRRRACSPVAFRREGQLLVPAASA
jgi:hypothetical protein